ncbi:M23 family metallopeptidase [Pseudogracilibacillus sp. SO30301A]|uniref:M23 family metallopeptidase n=1 Tax=Pseudogracilibacillus sp. SO30301A TaxID=3098291 RepID=UPI00300E26AB
MDRGVQKVRQSIKQRKRDRDRTKLNNRKTLPFTATDEEKHGFFDVPAYDISSSIKKTERKTISFHLLKATGSIVLFFFVAFLMQTNLPTLKPVKDWAHEVLHEEFPFAKVNEWYVSKFGSPLSFTPQGTVQVGQEEQAMALPVLGQVVETFSANGTGIMISPEEKTAVSTISRGVVIFAGNDRNTHKTVIVQHADGSKTTYGYLSSIDVHIYQTVNANQTIGTFQPTEDNEMVYFSIEKDKEFIDPSQVIKVDDIP